MLTFQLAYAIGLLVMGRVVDWLGTRKGFSLAVLVWSAAAMAHAAARTVLQFAIVRFALGLGESGNFPASIKTIAEWFPKKERALATGIFNSGTNIGAIVTPLVDSVDHVPLRLADGVHRHGRAGTDLGDGVVDALSPARGRPPPLLELNLPTSAAIRQNR